MKTTFLSLSLLTVSMVALLAGPSDSADPKSMAAPVAVSDPDAGFYVAAYGGANVSQDYGNGRNEFNGPGGPFIYHGSTSDHVGGVGGLKVGYNFDSFPIGGDFRLQFATELEAFYLGTKTDIHSQFSPRDTFDITGNMNNAAGMLNGIVRLKTGTLFTPYIGVGIGTEYLTFTRPVVKETGSPFEPAQHNANEFSAAVQALGGFDFALAKHWTLFTEYKYLVALDPSLDFGNATIDGPSYNLKIDPYELGQHIVTAGVKYSF